MLIIIWLIIIIIILEHVKDLNHGLHLQNNIHWDEIESVIVNGGGGGGSGVNLFKHYLIFYLRMCIDKECKAC